jgi:hypothetical protein
MVMKPDPKQPDTGCTAEQLIKSMVVYGSAETVAEKILGLRQRTGPFGTLLMASMDGSGANREREWETMRRLATAVMPAVRAELGRRAATTSKCSYPRKRVSRADRQAPAHVALDSRFRGNDARRRVSFLSDTIVFPQPELG